MLNDVYCAADNGARTMLLQLDLSSAFDTIDMCTLLRRLRFTFEISGPALNWISSYLACRSQADRVGHQQSSSISCEYGVPQGSVLGPLLFTLFMSPISNVISSFGVSQTQYADHTTVHRTQRLHVSPYTVGLFQCRSTLARPQPRTQTKLRPLSSTPLRDNERKVRRAHSTFSASASDWRPASEV